jgi:hypothetical protein
MLQFKPKIAELTARQSPEPVATQSREVHLQVTLSYRLSGHKGSGLALSWSRNQREIQ